MNLKFIDNFEHISLNSFSNKVGRISGLEFEWTRFRTTTKTGQKIAHYDNG